MEGMATERAGFCGEMAESLDNYLMMLRETYTSFRIGRLISHVFWKFDEHQTCICAFPEGIMSLSELIPSCLSLHFVRRLSHTTKSLAKFKTIESTMDHQEFSSSITAKHNSLQE